MANRRCAQSTLTEDDLVPLFDFLGLEVTKVRVHGVRVCAGTARKHVRLVPSWLANALLHVLCSIRPSAKRCSGSSTAIPMAWCAAHARSAPSPHFRAWRPATLLSRRAAQVDAADFSKTMLSRDTSQWHPTFSSKLPYEALARTHGR